MLHFRPSIIATMVTSALAVATLPAANAASVKTLDISAAKLAKLTSTSTSNKARKLANKKTTSGMKSSFDSKLNKATFVWQNAQQQRPEMIMVAPEKRNAYAAEHYLKSLTGMSTNSFGVDPAILNKKSTNQAVLTHIHDIKRGGIIARYSQQVHGVEVFNRNYNVMMNRDHKLVAGSGYFADVDKTTSQLSSKKVINAFGNPANAIAKAYTDMGGDGTRLQLAAGKSKDKYTTFNVSKNGAGKQLAGVPRSKKVYFEQNGQLLAAHYVEVQVAEVESPSTEYYSYVIDANTQKILFKKNLKSHAEDFSYRAYANSDAPYAPWDSPHGNVNPAVTDEDPTAYLDAPLVTLSSGPISTMDPWLDDDATETIGNNVHAYADVVPGDGLTFGDFTADLTSDGTFDYKYDTSQKEHAMHNRKASIVNMFYVNNYLHDEFYDHGFDEASGNAQMDNYDRGGEEGDPLKVEVQDYSGTDNANMSTPADGVSPRMQMFLWNQAKDGVHFGVSSSSHADLDFSSARASFGPGTYNVDGEIVRFVDGTEPSLDGCEAATNGADLAGKIALIDRGTCSFALKVMNAQDAGAIGVLIANNRGGDIASGLGGTGDDVTIPALMITQNNGASIQALLDNGESVTVNVMGTEDIPFKDSSWDNAIVSHEWGHYISNRLVGNASGLSNNQGRSMGEGWGDFHALLTVSEADEAMIAGNDMFQKPYAAITYVRSFVNGIRLYPYTTDMDINPHTFDNIEDNAEVHASGNVWASMLWDAFVGLINDDRYDYADAKSMMMDYLVAGYKMTPNAPTFVEARDAILAAAFANDEDDYDTILAAFARRGLGWGAVAPDRDSRDHLGVIESYSLTHAELALSAHVLNVNYEGMMGGFCTNDYILDKGETGTATFTVSNLGSEEYWNVEAQVEVVSDHDVTFANDGMVVFEELFLLDKTVSEPLEFTLNEAGTAEELVMKLTFPGLEEESNEQAYMFSTVVNYSFADKALEGNGHTATNDAEDLSILNDFKERVLAGGEMAEGTSRLSREHTDTWGDFGVAELGGEASLFITNHGFLSDVVFETKPITVGLLGNFEVSWMHYYNFETDFDGGVVEISINDSPWLDVLDTGAQFTGEGYTGELIAHSSQPLPDRMAFTGVSAGFESVVFPSFMNGNTVRFRFRAGSDGGSAAEGWLIDQFEFTNVDSGVFSQIIAGDTQACENRAPVIDSGDERTVSEGDEVTLMVEVHDVNSDELSYSWSQVSGTSVRLSDDDTASPTFTAPAVTDSEDTLMFEVTVSDGDAMATATVTVKVNSTPVVTLAESQSVIEGAEVSLTATAVDANNDRLSYSWTQLSGQSVTLSGANTAEAGFSAPTGLGGDNEFQFELTVTDGHATVTNTTTVKVNALPVVVTGDEQQVNEGDSVSLQASATDGNGDDLTYSWTQLSGTTVTLSDENSATPGFVAPASATGRNVLEFQVSVNDGANTVTGTTIVIINSLPLVSAGRDQTVGPGVVVNLRAIARDADGDNLSYSWTQVSGPEVGIALANTSRPAFFAPQQSAEIELMVTVSDGTGSKSDTVKITVSGSRVKKY